MIPLLIAAGAALAGGAASYASSKSKEKAARQANEENAALAAQNLANNKALLDKMFGEQSAMFSPGASSYQQLLGNYIGQNTYQPGKFEYGKSIEDFYSPAAQMRINQAMNAIQNSRANAGGMFSSDTLGELNARAQTMASEEYDKAYNRYLGERGLALNEWNANQSEEYKAWQSQLDKNKTLLSMADADRRALANASSDYYSNIINANNAALSTTAGINVANANAKANPWDAVGAGIGMGMGAYSLFK